MGLASLRKSCSHAVEARNHRSSTPASVEVLTLDQQLDRYIEFAAQCYIRSGTRLINFSPLYDYQIELARLAISYRGLIIVKDRQLGITESLSCWMLDRARSNPGYAGVVFSMTEKDAFKVSNRVKRMPSRIDGFEWEVDSLGLRQPQQGGELNFRASTENGSRGLESIWDEYIDEAGFVRSNLISELYAASSPSQEMVGDYARTFIVSTIPPIGLDCWFFERFQDGLPDKYTTEELLDLARSGGSLNDTKIKGNAIPGFVAVEDEGGWVHVAISHKAHPVYGADPNYVQKQRSKKKITEEQANREHNLTLPISGGSLFRIQSVMDSAIGQWEPPVKDRRYLMGIDPNMGSSDSWAALVWDITSYPFSLVAEYVEANQLPSYCIQKTLELIDQYRPDICAVEKNNGGLGVAENLIKARAWLEVETVNTSNTSKIINTDRISLALTNGDVVLPPDWEGIGEMKRFSAVDRRAMGNAKDDRVMSMSVAFAMLDQTLENHREAERLAAALRAMS